MKKIALVIISLVFALCISAVGTRTSSQRRLATPAAACDTLPPAAALPDSAPSLHDILLPDSADTLAGTDTLVLAADSVARPDSVKKRESGLEAPVEYSAADSMVYDARNKRMYLFGGGEVAYQDMTLTAGRIEMSLDSSLVHATYVLKAPTDTSQTDSVKDQKPVFHQRNDEYESERMSFNFKTKKGFINNVSTTQGNGFVTSERSKRTNEGTVFLEKATYTTCDAPHPHFYLKLSRAKMIPGKETVFGPAYLVVEDVPLPLGIPYGFFPINKKYSSGFIMPTLGDETSRGFYLREGGYYFAINDYIDLKLLGEIYTKGSWGVSLESNYRKRYKYNGNFYFSFIKTVEGERNMPDYSVTNSLKVQWTHTKENAGNSNTTFSARVNFASENYERKNLASMYNPLSYTQSTRASAISFSHTFPNIGLTIAASANLTQNMRDSSISVTLPDVSINLQRFYPFRRKKQAGKERWYEKISIAYNGEISNRISTKENKLLKSNLIKDWKNGMQHRIPIDATFQLFKYINISPNFSFRDIMYSSRIMRSWDRENQVEKSDTTYGFYNLYDWSVGVSINTTLYGFYKPSRKLFGDKIQAIRHVFKPTISLSYAPDFTVEHYGYVRYYDKVDADGNVSQVRYSPYSDGSYGYPSGQKQGLLTMSISNNLEMKIKSDKDSTGFKKISLIDELAATLSYNFAAKKKPWSDLNMRLRLKLTKSYTFSLNAVFATYAYEFNDRGQVVVGDRTEWSHGRFGRFQGMSQSFSYTFNNQTFKKLKEKFSGKSSTKKEVEEAEETETDADDANLDPELAKTKHMRAKQKVKAKVDKDGYMSFSIPWSLTLSYGITMYEDRTKPIREKRMRYPYSFTHNLNASGYIRIADGWNISFTSGYDFKMKEISMTTASLSRDLHCFEMTASVVLRPYSSFNFTFRARANELMDALKWDKRSSYSSNIEWY